MPADRAADLFRSLVASGVAFGAALDRANAHLESNDEGLDGRIEISRAVREEALRQARKLESEPHARRHHTEFRLIVGGDDA